jgi:hypothetical protein
MKGISQRRHPFPEQRVLYTSVTSRVCTMYGIPCGGSDRQANSVYHSTVGCMATPFAALTFSSRIRGYFEVSIDLIQKQTDTYTAKHFIRYLNHFANTPTNLYRISIKPEQDPNR